MKLFDPTGEVYDSNDASLFAITYQIGQMLTNLKLHVGGGYHLMFVIYLM